MRARTLLGAVLVAAASAAAFGLRRPTWAQEGPVQPPGGNPAEAEPVSPGISPKAVLQGLDRIIRKLDRNDGALALGDPSSKTLRAFPGAAAMAGEYLLPLGGSFLDPSATLHGSIRWSFGSVKPRSAPVVDAIQVVLLTGKTDRESIRSTLKAAGKAVGLDFEADENDPDTWWDVDSERVDVWVAIGDGVVVVDAGPND